MKIKKFFCMTILLNFIFIFPFNTGTTAAARTITQLGDVNYNRIIDIVDALLVAQSAVGLNPANFDLAAADVNFDNSIDIIDAMLIAKYSIGDTTAFKFITMTLVVHGNDDIGATGGGYVQINPPSLDGISEIHASYSAVSNSEHKLSFYPKTEVTFNGVVLGYATLKWYYEQLNKNNPVTLIINGGEILTADFWAPDPTPRPSSTPSIIP